MENRYYIKTILPFIKLLIETVESLEKKNNNLIEKITDMKSKPTQQINNFEIILTNKEILHIIRAIGITKYDFTRNVKIYKELEELESKLKNKLNALYGEKGEIKNDKRNYEIK